MAESKKSQKFEDALKRLEEIAEKLESGDQPLEKSLALFEEGIKLSRFCSTKLNEAEKKISLLMKNKSGDLELKEFDSEEETLFEPDEEEDEK
jgi:exodeoxyribonuclease VII small subunit